VKQFDKWRHLEVGGGLDDNGFYTNIDASRDISAVRELSRYASVPCSPLSTYPPQINPFFTAVIGDNVQ